MQVFVTGENETHGVFATAWTENGATIGAVDTKNYTSRRTERKIEAEIGEDSVLYRIPRTLLPEGTLWLKAADSRETIRCGADFYDKGDTVPAGRLWFVVR